MFICVFIAVFRRLLHHAAFLLLLPCFVLFLLLLFFLIPKLLVAAVDMELCSMGLWVVGCERGGCCLDLSALRAFFAICPFPSPPTAPAHSTNSIWDVTKTKMTSIYLCIFLLFLFFIISSFLSVDNASLPSGKRGEREEGECVRNWISCFHCKQFKAVHSVRHTHTHTRWVIRMHSNYCELTCE